jgi:hypothetical protein
MALEANISSIYSRLINYPTFAKPVGINNHKGFAVQTNNIFPATYIPF